MKKPLVSRKAVTDADTAGCKIRSVTRIELSNNKFVETIVYVEIWRDEPDFGPYHLSNQDLYDKAEEACKNLINVHETARAFLEMDRVVKVIVWNGETGYGIELEKDE